MSDSSSVAAPPAVLGKDVVVIGDIESSVPLIIEGEVDGNIGLPDHRLTIAANARVRANVVAREIEVHGSLTGLAEITERLHLTRSAEVFGDIYAGGLVIDDGAFIKGSVEVAPKAATA